MHAGVEAPQLVRDRIHAREEPVLAGGEQLGDHGQVAVAHLLRRGLGLGAALEREPRPADQEVGHARERRHHDHRLARELLADPADGSPDPLTGDPHVTE